VGVWWFVEYSADGLSCITAPEILTEIQGIPVNAHFKKSRYIGPTRAVSKHSYYHLVLINCVHYRSNFIQCVAQKALL